MDELALRVAEMSEESGDTMPEVAVLRHQCMRLRKVAFCARTCIFVLVKQVSSAAPRHQCMRLRK